MESPFDSIKNTVLARSKSTLFGSIVISWSVFNWDSILLLLFSSKVIEAKINIISQTSITQAAILPVVVGIIVAIIYPLLSYIPWLIDHKIEQVKSSRNKENIPKEEAISFYEKLEHRNEEMHKVKREKFEEIEKIRSQIYEEFRDKLEENANSMELQEKEHNQEVIHYKEEAAELKKKQSRELSELKNNHEEEKNEIINRLESLGDHRVSEEKGKNIRLKKELNIVVTELDECRASLMTASKKLENLPKLHHFISLVNPSTSSLQSALHIAIEQFLSFNQDRGFESLFRDEYASSLASKIVKELTSLRFESLNDAFSLLAAFDHKELKIMQGIGVATKDTDTDVVRLTMLGSLLHHTLSS